MLARLALYFSASFAVPRRESHSESQRGPTSGDGQPCRAIVEAGQVPSGPCRTTPSDARELTGGQGVAGSNPAVPTGSRIFSNVFMSYREPAKEPISLRNDLLRPCADRVPRCPTRAFATTAELRSRLVKGSKIAEPLPEQPRSPGATRGLTAAQRWMTRSSKPAFDRGARAALGGVLPYRAAAWVGPPGGWVEEYERH